MPDENQSEQGLGCAIGTVFVGAFIVWVGFYSNLGTGTRPIGTGASLLFGGAFMVAGIVGVIREIIKTLRKG